MTWHCPCGRRNRDNNDRCTKCEGPQNIPSWAKPSVSASRLPIRSAAVAVLIASAVGIMMVHPGKAQMNYQTPTGDTVLPATASVNPTLTDVDPGTGEGDTKPWTQYGSSDPTDLPTSVSPSPSSPDSPSSTPTTEEPMPDSTNTPSDNPVATVGADGRAHSAPKPARPTNAPEAAPTPPPADGGYYDESIDKPTDQPTENPADSGE